jgi:hypothetical protein
MATTDRTLRVVVAASLTAGMAALWAGSAYHYGDAGASAASMVADVHAYPAAQLVNAVSLYVETVCFTIAAIGLAALVRGRGRTFLLVACGVLALGLPSHVMGATMQLTLHQLASSDLPVGLQVSVLESVQGLFGVYFALILPFLLGLVLLTAALWRARVVGWQPFAVLVADIALGMTVNGSHTPSDWMWWIDPVVTIAAFAWVGLRVLRYRGDANEVPTVEAHAEPAPEAVRV